MRFAPYKGTKPAHLESVRLLFTRIGRTIAKSWGGFLPRHCSLAGGGLYHTLLYAMIDVIGSREVA